MLFHRYVALGDSQTEGMNDLDAHGGIRGWADRFAVYLAEQNPDLLYANLAIRGRRTKRIRADQLEPALGLNPDLASVMAGANDVLGSFDLDETMTDLEDMYAALRGIGATVIGCTFPDPGASFTIGRRLTPRVRALNAAIRDAAARHDVVLVDFEAYPAVNDPAGGPTTGYISTRPGMHGSPSRSPTSSAYTPTPPGRSRCRRCRRAPGGEAASRMASGWPVSGCPGSCVTSEVARPATTACPNALPSNP